MEIEKAKLVFLDAIERRQGEIADAICAQPETIKAAIESMAGAIVKAIQESARQVVSTRAVVVPPESNAPVIEAIIALNNSQAIAANKLINEFKIQVDRIIQSNFDIVSALNRGKMVSFKIDRNYYTQLIQKLEAEVNPV